MLAAKIVILPKALSQNRWLFAYKMYCDPELLSQKAPTKIGWGAKGQNEPF